MKRRSNRWSAPSPSGTRPTDPPEVIDLYPNPLPPPSVPVTRETKLARLQTGFAALDENELRVAVLWLTGATFEDVCARVGMPEPAVRTLWRQMRRKLRAALQGTTPS